jgi:hypothetical protein
MSHEETGLDPFERVMEGITHVEVLADNLTLKMQQRLMAIECCFRGIFGGLDGLQENIYDARRNLQAAPQKCT